MEHEREHDTQIPGMSFDRDRPEPAVMSVDITISATGDHTIHVAGGPPLAVERIVTAFLIAVGPDDNPAINALSAQLEAQSSELQGEVDRLTIDEAP